MLAFVDDKLGKGCLNPACTAATLKPVVTGNAGAAAATATGVWAGAAALPPPPTTAATPWPVAIASATSLVWLCSKTTMMAVILSPPKPLVFSKSGDKHASSNSLATDESRKSPFRGDCLQELCLFKRLRTKSTACWLETTSQIPSHAMTKNSSAGCRCTTCTSGSTLMTWAPALRPRSCLYSRSPIALDKLRSPLTRCTTVVPWSSRSTHPPAREMRSISRGSSGLWSLERSTAKPPRHSTARLSPAFATIKVSAWTQQTTAVQPMPSGCTPNRCTKELGPVAGSESFISSHNLDGSLSNSSIRKKAALIAEAMSWVGPLTIAPGKCFSQNRAT
mmetsp:Transcript_23200/g.61781  ORF Transcript_23200/g.61781 Transcript_23200/m.61781 type:complete len:335 (-) Transcript_23200:415-1419(-)